MAFDPKQHLTQVKGQDYLEVKWRIAWFRDAHPEGLITTELVPGPPNVAIFRATVSKEIEGALATGYGSCRFDQFDAPFEKAETKAIGRALAALGFGVQFAGDDFADDTVQAPPPRQQQQQPRQQQNVVPPPSYEPQGGREHAEEQVQQQYQQEQTNWASQYDNHAYEPPPADDREMPQQRVPVGFGNPPTSGANAATTAQVKLINFRLDKRVPPQEHSRIVASYNNGDVDVNNISKQDASRLIDHLNTLPDLPGGGAKR